ILPAQPAVAILAAYGWLVWRAQWRVPALAALLVLWLAVKVAHVGWVMPGRLVGRDPEAGRGLAGLVPPGGGVARGGLKGGERRVPPGEVLYLAGIKDENLLFVYGRPARRVAAVGEARGYCLMPGDGQGRCVVARLRGSQGDAVALVLVEPSPVGPGVRNNRD